MLFLYRSRLALAALACILGHDALACSSCGCTLGTEWADQNYSAMRGLSLGLRYDFVDQNQLREGRSPVDTAGLTTGQIGNEIQQGTLTNFYTLSAAYTFNRDWGLDLQLPYLIRQHGTLAEGDDPQVSGSDYAHIGDLRLVGRYQGFLRDRSLGVQLGLKLPTGPFHDTFSSGPQQGEGVDRGLQTGSGTTDLILGVYHHGSIGRNWDRFEQLQLKQPLGSREQFRPPTQFSVNLGLRYVGNAYVIPQAQLNVKVEGHETGDPEVADYPDSGSRVVYVSPGIASKPVKGTSMFGFVQVPVYQDYSGYQLAPRYTLSVGINHRF